MTEHEILEDTRHKHVDAIAILENQAASYGANVPINIALQLEERQDALKEVERKLDEIEELTTDISHSLTYTEPSDNIMPQNIHRIDSRIDIVIDTLGEMRGEIKANHAHYAEHMQTIEHRLEHVEETIDVIKARKELPEGLVRSISIGLLLVTTLLSVIMFISTLG